MTNGSGNHFYIDAGHQIARLICQGIYLLLGGVYNILIQISKSQIISSSDMAKFYARVQLIIGVFMLFRLSFSIVQGIIDPEKFSDSKKGFSGLIVKVITALALLTLIVPISNMPNKSLNSYEKNVKDNGILFGTLYEFQNRVLDQQLLAKLIMGVNKGSDELNDTGKDLSVIVLRSFFTPNLKEGSDTKAFIDKKTGKFKHKYLYCNVYKDQKDDKGNKITDFGSRVGQVREAYKKYYSPKSDTSTILNMINQGCESEYSSLSGWDSYAFNFNWFAGLIVGLLFLIILVLMCLEIAKRAIKLALLRLIAPIPIIGYMNPDSDMQNGPLGAWIKALVSTYLELFFYLLVIFFAIFVIQSIDSHGGLDFDGTAGLFAKIFVYLGLIFFAKDAPKFLRQALGMKEDAGSGLFSGLGQIRKAAGIGAGVGAAAVGGIGTGIRYGKEHNQEGLDKDQKHGLKRAWRIAGNVGSGLLGSMTSMASGTKAAVTAKDHRTKAAINAQNEKALLRETGSTAPGRVKATAERTFGNLYADNADANAKKYQEYNEAMEKVISRVKDKAATATDTTSNFETNGYHIQGNYADFMSKWKANEHNDSFEFNGEQINTEDAALIAEEFKKKNEAAYFTKYSDTSWIEDNEEKFDKDLVEYVAVANDKSIGLDKNIVGTKITSSSSFGSDIKERAGKSSRKASELRRGPKYKKSSANRDAIGGGGKSS